MSRSAEKSEIELFNRLVQAANRIVGFTGAGVSTEAGIADYRSQGGIYERFKPVSLNEFIHDPVERQLYWERMKMLWQSISRAEPTRAHRYFADLHRRGRLLGLITQNIDGLHERSGLPADCLVNLHGTCLEIVCLDCGDLQDSGPLMQRLDPLQPPSCSRCGGLLKPNTISFGQRLSEGELLRAERLSRGGDLMIAAGSTLQVQPAATFPLIARDAGAKLIIVTLSPTPLDRYADLVVNRKLGDVLRPCQIST